jgi:hypothetical protein
VSEGYEPRPVEIQAMLELVNAVPALRPALEEHLSDHEVMLSHLLMADFGRVFVKLVGANDQITIAAFLSEIERLAASADAGLTNVVAVSFIENLWLGGAQDRAALEAVRPLLGPATTAALATTEQHYP